MTMVVLDPKLSCRNKNKASPGWQGLKGKVLAPEGK